MNKRKKKKDLKKFLQSIQPKGDMITVLFEKTFVSKYPKPIDPNQPTGIFYQD